MCGASDSDSSDSDEEPLAVGASVAEPCALVHRESAASSVPLPAYEAEAVPRGLVLARAEPAAGAIQCVVCTGRQAQLQCVRGTDEPARSRATVRHVKQRARRRGTVLPLRWCTSSVANVLQLWCLALQHGVPRCNELCCADNGARSHRCARLHSTAAAAHQARGRRSRPPHSTPMGRLTRGQTSSAAAQCHLRWLHRLLPHERAPLGCGGAKACCHACWAGLYMRRRRRWSAAKAAP